jgi:hypothetical protein
MQNLLRFFLLFAIFFTAYGCGGSGGGGNNPTPTPPTPSLDRFTKVTISGYQMVVQQRQADGSLGQSQTWLMKGPSYPPASIGNDGSIEARAKEFIKWKDTDAALLQQLGANTIRVFMIPGFTTAEALQVLDAMYAKGIFVIVNVDNDGKGELQLAAINALKNHPAQT